MYRADLPLRGFDQEVRETVATNLAARGTGVHAGANPVSIAKNDDGSLTLALDDGTKIETDCVMWATGRVPNTDRPDLGLKEVASSSTPRAQSSWTSTPRQPCRRSTPWAT